MTPRKKTNMDPTSVNTYNKFLITLDTKYRKDVPTIDISSNDISLNHSHTELDNMITRIENEIAENNYDVSSFTGQNTVDDNFINNVDANYYNNIANPSHLWFYNQLLMPTVIPPLHVKSNEYIHTKKHPRIPSPIPYKDDNINTGGEILKTVHIDTEINTISDILQLIETYPYDPRVEYNINMKTLHDIKIPLQELDNMIGMKKIKSSV